MTKLTIDDLHELQETSLSEMKTIRGGLSRSASSLSFGDTRTGRSTADQSPGGPRPREDQIIWPENEFDIIKLI